MHLLVLLQDQAANILYIGLARATYKEDIVGALKDHYGDHKLAPSYQYNFKARTQLTGMPLQELAATVTFVGLLRTLSRMSQPMHPSME